MRGSARVHVRELVRKASVKVKDSEFEKKKFECEKVYEKEKKLLHMRLKKLF